MQKCTAEPVWTIGERDITPMMRVYELFDPPYLFLRSVFGSASEQENSKLREEHIF